MEAPKLPDVGIPAPSKVKPVMYVIMNRKERRRQAAIKRKEKRLKKENKV